MSQPITHPNADNAINDGRLRQAQLKMLHMLKQVDNLCRKHQLEYWLDAGTLLGAVRHQGFIPWDDDMDIGMPRESFEKFLKIAPNELPDDIWLQTSQTDPGFYNMATPLKIRDRNSRYLEKHEHGNEPYVQGIFIDVFVYDQLPENPKIRKRYKFLAKKIIRVLSAKQSAVALGHHAAVYKTLGKILSVKWLEKKLNHLIRQSQQMNSSYLGRGYQCVGKNCLKREDIYPLKELLFEGEFFLVPCNVHELLVQQFGDYMTPPPEHQRVLRHCKELIPKI